jgi:hypothetical protein
MMLKSFYTLEMYISPGGARQALLFIANSIEEIKGALQSALSDNFQLHLLLAYGEDVRLCAHQKCQIVCDINLLPYLAIKIKGYGTFTIDEFQKVTPSFPEELTDLLLNNDTENLEITVFVDWSNLKIPVLEQPLLMPGAATILKEHYGDDRMEITREEIEAFEAAQGDPDELADLDIAYYGWNDREEGEIIESIDLFDSIASDAASVVFR